MPGGLPGGAADAAAHVTLPAPRPALQRLSASSARSISSPVSSPHFPGKPRPTLSEVDLLAPPPPAAAEGRMADPQSSLEPPPPQHRLANGSAGSSGSSGHGGGEEDAQPALLSMLRASRPMDDGGASSGDDGGGSGGRGSSARQHQATVELLGEALNGRLRPSFEGADAKEGRPAAGSGGSKRWGRLFNRAGSGKVPTAAAALEAAPDGGDVSDKSSGSSSKGSKSRKGSAKLEAAAEAPPVAPAAPTAAAAAELTGAAAAAAADAERRSEASSAKAGKAGKAAKAHSGWFGSMFGAKPKGGSPDSSAAAGAEHAAGDSGAHPIMGGLPFTPVGEEAGAGLASFPLATTPDDSLAGSLAPSPALASLLPSPDPEASPGGNSKKGHHKRHRSLTSFISHGLGLKGRHRRHSGGSLEEVIGDPDGLGDGQSSAEPTPKQGSKLGTPAAESLLPSKPPSTAGSPALSCFGLGSKQATVGDEADLEAVAHPVPAAPVLDPNLEVEEPPVLPLSALGIRNIGNSCFLGAALQCLRHTPHLPLLLVPDLLEQAAGIGSPAAAAKPGGAAVEAPRSEDGSAGQSQQAGSEQGEEEGGAAASPHAVGEAMGAAAAAEGGSVPPGAAAAAAAAAAAGQAQAATAPEGDAPAAGLPATEEAGEQGAAPAPAAAGGEGGGEASDPATEGEGQEQPAAAVAAPAAAAAPAKPQRPEHGELLACFSQLIKDLYKQTGAPTAVDPYPLLSLLRQFPTAADYFDGGQHDCQEVLRALLDLLHEELNRVPQPPPKLEEEKPDPQELESAKADRHWGRYLSRDCSPITDLFSGQLQSSVRCHGCNRRFTMYEPFWDLSLPLAKEGKNSSLSWLGIKGTPASIQDCLRVFTADELLEGEEAFHCEVCKDKTSATKHLRLHRLPDVLVLHIKRFKYKGTNTDKLAANVSFPLKELSLHQFVSPESPCAPEDCVYDLFAVSNHYGTLSGGHYTAMCRVPLDGGREAWYSYNDEIVQKISGQQAVSQHAYMLFYSRRKYKPRAGGKGDAASGHRRAGSTASSASGGAGA